MAKILIQGKLSTHHRPVLGRPCPQFRSALVSTAEPNAWEAPGAARDLKFEINVKMEKEGTWQCPF